MSPPHPRFSSNSGSCDWRVTTTVKVYSCSSSESISLLISCNVRHNIVLKMQCEVNKMSMMVKILKSDNVEAEERQIERIKEEIEFLTIDLQIKEDKLQRIKQK